MLTSYTPRFSLIISTLTAKWKRHSFFPLLVNTVHLIFWSVQSLQSWQYHDADCHFCQWWCNHGRTMLTTFQQILHFRRIGEKLLFELGSGEKLVRSGLVPGTGRTMQRFESKKVKQHSASLLTTWTNTLRIFGLPASGQHQRAVHATHCGRFTHWSYNSTSCS